ncbi:conserved Plasmodium protein, unknown function [Plasmodium chabaudi chabaudi]|uniref:Uncharacterized protein n=1 Tax=Plasmodium chabaudi chabaudi TaxID=31271 RepID=A0A4V0JZV6_PLACU|nr:conserved Plasmodium protein, unknown function [Plasmodium chabaudi chabaudi]VTZ66251.1 conserved Plasmodium protein, unknown function [Plasmodium chabaudi chabaudi]|eukprot:XP_743275.1 conserved Plasmodium protein, unknown function [Plasmodium chabaudi chabaudi]
MKTIYCFLYFCNGFFSGTTYNRKTIFNLNIKKVKDVGNKHPQKSYYNFSHNFSHNFTHKLYIADEGNYSQFDINRDNEYNDILNDIIYEYEKEKKEKNKEGESTSQIADKSEEEKNKNKANTNSHTYIPKNIEPHKSQNEKEEQDEKDAPLWEKEIKRINKLKSNNLLNLCDLNYDLLKLAVNTSKVDESNEDENYNKISLFLESQVMNKNKGEPNMCIDDSIGRYFLNVDDNFIQTISEKELHCFKNIIHKKIIYLKYQYLKKYKSAIDEVKKVSKTKTEEINKHVSLVYEGDEHGEDGKDDENNENGKDGEGKNNICVNYSEENEMETKTPELSLEKINEMIDLNQKLSKLQKNFEDLKKFDIFKVLNENRFLNNLKVSNFQFVDYPCASLKEDMDQFLKKIKTKQNENGGSEMENYCYLSVPKMNDMHFLNNDKKTIIINVPTEENKEKKILKPVKELDIETDKAILLLSQNDKNLNVSVRNICDKIGYLTQGLCIYPRLHSEINDDESDNDKAYLKNEQLIKRLLILLIFYFKIQNVYVICMDDRSSKLFYNFIKNNNNILKDFYTWDVKEETDGEPNPNFQKREYVDLNEITFSHVFNKNFVPLYTTESIIKNYVFLMDKDEKFYDISFFKRSCLFMFLNKNLDKQSHVFFSKVQHFFYYKKFDYPYIYNIDNKYSVSTLKSFNEIILYLTTWIDIFNTGESENLNSADRLSEDEQEQDSLEPDISSPTTSSDEVDPKYNDEYGTSMEDEYSEFGESGGADGRECTGGYGDNP